MGVGLKGESKCLLHTFVWSNNKLRPLYFVSPLCLKDRLFGETVEDSFILDNENREPIPCKAFHMFSQALYMFSTRDIDSFIER